MLKLFGAGLTMFSCFAAGCLICAEMKKRIHILEELRRMTVMLSAEIGYANTMLDEAFGSKNPQSGFHSRFQIFWYMCRKRCKKEKKRI